MNSLTCVNCRNEKSVNSTDNRLVTESCGHVKCINCLVREKNGCVACMQEVPEVICSVEFEDSGGERSPAPNSPEETKESVEKPFSVANKEIQCQTDDDYLKKKKPETSHIKIYSDGNGKYYECTVCLKKFHAHSQVAYHAYCNGQRKPYTCQECHKSFATHSHYTYHMRVHRNERNYPCEDCGEAFFQKSKLQRHKLKHTKEKKYSCSQCNKAFNNMTSLRNHGLTHSEERPYACPTCSRRFRDSSNYRKHVAKHEKKCMCGRGVSCSGCSSSRGGRRAHQCPRCPQAFHSGKDMRRHAAVHTDSKPFRCKVCNRRFRRKDNLERHIRNTHPDYVPATAVECDEAALKQIIANGNTEPTIPELEKNKLEILNPLPPLPAEVIQKHMHENGNTKKDTNSIKNDSEVIDKSYIIVANNARQSVIVEKKSEAKSSRPAQECEYVHKIRKASVIPLPPIDLRKMKELEEKINLNKFDLGSPPRDKKTLYEKILYGDTDKREHEEASVESSTNMHWRRKMKQSVSLT